MSTPRTELPLHMSRYCERLVDGDYDRMSVLHNSYKSMIAYDQVEKSLDNMAAYTKSARSGFEY